MSWFGRCAVCGEHLDSEELDYCYSCNGGEEWYHREVWPSDELRIDWEAGGAPTPELTEETFEVIQPSGFDYTEEVWNDWCKDKELPEDPLELLMLNAEEAPDITGCEDTMEQMLSIWYDRLFEAGDGYSPILPFEHICPMCLEVDCICDPNS